MTRLCLAVSADGHEAQGRNSAKLCKNSTKARQHGLFVANVLLKEAVDVVDAGNDRLENGVGDPHLAPLSAHLAVVAAVPNLLPHLWWAWKDGRERQNLAPVEVEKEYNEEPGRETRKEREANENVAQANPGAFPTRQHRRRPPPLFAANGLTCAGERA